MKVVHKNAWTPLKRRLSKTLSKEEPFENAGLSFSSRGLQRRLSKTMTSQLYGTSLLHPKVDRYQIVDAFTCGRDDNWKQIQKRSCGRKASDAFSYENIYVWTGPEICDLKNYYGLLPTKTTRTHSPKLHSTKLYKNQYQPTVWQNI